MPLAVDTNVLARAIIDDGTSQSELARECLLLNVHHVPDTVLLETEWLLRSVFGLSRAVIVRLLADLLASDNARFADRENIARAILAYGDGLDFANAMHLFSAKGCTEFVTYDAALIKKAPTVSSDIVVRKP
jgi:predicted nucleic-acid-binding protein